MVIKSEKKIWPWQVKIRHLPTMCSLHYSNLLLINILHRLMFGEAIELGIRIEETMVGSVLKNRRREAGRRRPPPCCTIGRYWPVWCKDRGISEHRHNLGGKASWTVCSSSQTNSMNSWRRHPCQIQQRWQHFGEVEGQHKVSSLEGLFSAKRGKLAMYVLL